MPHDRIIVESTDYLFVTISIFSLTKVMSSAVVKTLGTSRYSVILTPKEKNADPQPNWFWKASISHSPQDLVWVKMDSASAGLGVAKEFVQAVSLVLHMYYNSTAKYQNAWVLYNKYATQWVWFNKVTYVHTRDFLPHEDVFCCCTVI